MKKAMKWFFTVVLAEIAVYVLFFGSVAFLTLVGGA